MKQSGLLKIYLNQFLLTAFESPTQTDFRFRSIQSSSGMTIIKIYIWLFLSTVLCYLTNIKMCLNERKKTEPYGSKKVLQSFLSIGENGLVSPKIFLNPSVNFEIVL